MSDRPGPPRASIAIPTRARAGYLDVTLASIIPQATALGAEVVVISDGPDPATAATAARHHASCSILTRPAGLNAARNRAVDCTTGELIVFLDDDVQAAPGWLEALLAAAAQAPRHDVFGGPITARLEGGGPRACGREQPPITTLHFGARDRDVPFVWGANMAVRRRAFDRVGRFDEALAGRGDEEEWEDRYVAAGGRIRYVAQASVTHRRTRRDATVRALSRAQYALGRTARRNDVRKGSAPAAGSEWRTLAGCLWHIARRRCAVGIVMLAHSAGRVRELIGESRR